MALYKKEKNQIINHIKEIIINNNNNKQNQYKNKLKINEIYNIDYINYNNIFHHKATNINNLNKQKNLLKEKDKKIEDLQILCQSLQKQLLIKTEYINNKEKEIIHNITDDVNKVNINYNLNTSTNFPIKSEIKKLWEEFALMSILDNFIDYENNPELIFFLTTEIIVILQELINDICKDIYEKVSISLNISNDKNFLYDIEKTSRPLIKEHLNKIFINTEQKPFFNKFIELYKNSLKIKYKDIDIEQVIINNDFFSMIKKIKDILLFIKFNDPPLLFNIEQNINKRKCEKIFIDDEKNKKDYLIINDNGLKKVHGIIILKSPVMKNGFPLNNDLRTIIMLEQNDNNDNDNDNDNDNINDDDSHCYIENNVNKNITLDENSLFLRNIPYNHTINGNERDINNIKEEFNINKNIDYFNKQNKNIFRTYGNNNKLMEMFQKNIKNKTEENIKVKNSIRNDNNINSKNDIISNYSYVSENLNVKNEYNENSLKSVEIKPLSSGSREMMKSEAYLRGHNYYNNIKETNKDNSLIKYEQTKNNTKVKKINIIKKNKIKINMSKINNNIKHYKYNRKSPKENLLFFYSKQLPLLLKNNYKEKNRIKQNNIEKMKMKKKSNNKIDNFSTEIYSKEAMTNNNNDLLIKNKTVKELINVNHRKNKDFSKVINNQKKINNSKNGIQIKDNKYKKEINSYHKIKNNLKSSIKSNVKVGKTKEKNKIKNNEIKSLLKCI